MKAEKGNGFLFKTHDANGLFWAIQQAMAFYNLPQEKKARQIQRIMKESAATFTHENTARQYIELYEKMLQRPLIIQNAPACAAEGFDRVEPPEAAPPE
jgi:starch synthase